MQLIRFRKSTLAAIFALLSANLAQAQFAPIPLVPSSYNQDVIVEAPNVVTTATMDNGPANTGASWYEMGYDTPSTGGGTGLPHPGTTITSSSASDHQYTFAPDYTTNNAILIDPTVTNATITFVSPAAYTGLSFLLAAGNGAETIAYKVHHADATVETGSIVAKDWFNNTPVAYTASGRVDVQGRVPDNVNAGNPRLYSTDITLTDTASAVTSIDFTRSGTGGHGAIFAISGTTGSGYNPITISGYNKDMIVEATAQYMPPNGLYTTASIDNSTGNTGNSFYAKGFDRNTGATTTGLPPAGSTIASAAALDHQYTFAPSYSSNNVVLIDGSNSGTLTWATPTKHSALSFLVTAGHGPVTVDYTVNHADSSTESGTVVVPDWFNNTPVAYNANGRTDVSTGVFDSVNLGNPRLYTVDISLANSVSPVTSVNLSYDPSNTGGLAVFFAVSGTGGTIAPVIASQPPSTNVYLGTSTSLGALVSGTPPLTNRWQKSTGGAFVNMTDAGEISGTGTTNLTFANLAFTDSADYQLIVANAAGSVTSSIAHVNVISTTPTVTVAGDSITIYNGSSPGAEQVTMAIDGTTSKYLNFGVGNSVSQTPPYNGPTGFVVTPGMGSTVVTGLRLYTANDSPERDPADFVLEGSNNGGSTYTTIATGTVSMPTDRNAGGQTLDPVNEFNREIHFVNHAAYTTYRWSVNNVRNNAAANSMQVGEVQLLGTTPPPQVTLTYTRISATQIQFQWPQGISLQSSTNVAGPYADVPGGNVSPTTVTITPGTMFFRVHVQ